MRVTSVWGGPKTPALRSSPARPGDLDPCSWQRYRALIGDNVPRVVLSKNGYADKTVVLLDYILKNGRNLL